MSDETHIAPNPGPQMSAFKSKADILIYGGGAGGGKSWALVAEPLRRIHNAGYKAAIFRRTYPQIKGPGGIWDEANKLYRSFGAQMRSGQELDARFPSGAVVSFCHLQHEDTKYEYQGHQICGIFFDELTHFTQTQFFYLLSRNRSDCGIRPYVWATCNPDAGSWVADFISWWIDDDGYADPQRSGRLRYFVRVNDQMHWADSREELIEQFPHYAPTDIPSVTFIQAELSDNPSLNLKDPGYRGRLMALPAIERKRLLECNWKASEGAIIQSEWLKEYSIADDKFHFNLAGVEHAVPVASCQRIATVDTAGTSKEKAAERRGDPPSWSVCGVWDSLPHFTTSVNGQKFVLNDLLFLRHVWRAQVDWNELKSQIPEVLQTWNVQKAFIENAHYGKPLVAEIKCCQTRLVGPVIAGMGDSSQGAKLERAVASGMLSRVELGKILLPSDRPSWMGDYVREMTVWTGLPKETSDQIDMTSYACYVGKRQSSSWGGLLKG